MDMDVHPNNVSGYVYLTSTLHYIDKHDTKNKLSVYISFLLVMPVFNLSCLKHGSPD